MAVLCLIAKVIPFGRKLIQIAWESRRTSLTPESIMIRISGESEAQLLKRRYFRNGHFSTNFLSIILSIIASTKQNCCKLLLSFILKVKKRWDCSKITLTILLNNTAKLWRKSLIVPKSKKKSSPPLTSVKESQLWSKAANFQNTTLIIALSMRTDISMSCQRLS